jgi:hypothetical protein
MMNNSQRRAHETKKARERWKKANRTIDDFIGAEFRPVEKLTEELAAIAEHHEFIENWNQAALFRERLQMLLAVATPLVESLELDEGTVLQTLHRLYV